MEPPELELDGTCDRQRLEQGSLCRDPDLDLLLSRPRPGVSPPAARDIFRRNFSLRRASACDCRTDGGLALDRFRRVTPGRDGLDPRRPRLGAVTGPLLETGVSTEALSQ